MLIHKHRARVSPRESWPLAVCCTAIGFEALRNDTTGAQNTAVGDGALHDNTNGNFNTAVGLAPLAENQTGDSNTAIGWGALSENTGNSNTAAGLGALTNNHGGGGNTAVGNVALQSNVSGSFNTATGFRALNDNSTGFFNTAFGYQALQNNTIASFNIAIGVNAGFNLTTGGSNIDIGNFGVAGEERKIRIGTQGTHNGTFIAGISGVGVSGNQVVVNASGKLGVAASSARFKERIKPMENANEAILTLKPVTFRYKNTFSDPARARTAVFARTNRLPVAGPQRCAYRLGSRTGMVRMPL